MPRRPGRGAAGGEIPVPPHPRYPCPLISPRTDAVRVLLVEDHKPLVRALRQGLEEEGYAVDTAHDGEEADFKASSAPYDVVVLDIMLPKMDGLTLLQKWRKAGVKSHVLMLTARDQLEDKVKGLDK